MENGVSYWFISMEDYNKYFDPNNNSPDYSGYSLSSFGTNFHGGTGIYEGYYFPIDEIDEDEMETLSFVPSFGIQIVNLSVQAGFTPGVV